MAARAVRVITDVAAVDRPFDYLLNDATQQAGIGDRIRIDFNHRSIRGWIVENVESSTDLKSVKKWLGYGPPPTMLDFLKWASERWYSSWSRFLLSASPRRIVTSLPTVPHARILSDVVRETGEQWTPGVIQLAPTTDPLALILGAYELTRESKGSLIVLVPTESWAIRLRGRLEQRGCDVAFGDDQWDRMRAGWPVVVGARGAALSPVPKIAGAVIIDADDESYRSSAAPTWDVVTMLRERCQRDQAPLWCTTMIPSPKLIGNGSFEVATDVANGWANIVAVDRRSSDPRDGVLSGDTVIAAHKALSGDEAVAVVVILQRLGTGRLLACRKCGELARCDECGQAEDEVEGGLSCSEHHAQRQAFCRSCGSTNLKRVRSGVTTLARDVGNQLSQVVSEVTSASDANVPLSRVVVGTEAVFQRVRRCGLVVFVDFDQYLLAPRESARRAAVTAVGKAARLVGSRKERRGHIILQTRRGDDIVVRSLESGDFQSLIDDDVATAKLLGLSPFKAIAEITGEGAEEFVQCLASPDVEVEPTRDGFIIRCTSIDVLTAALQKADRPVTKFRVAVE